MATLLFILVTYAIYSHAGYVKHESFERIYFCDCRLPREIHENKVLRKLELTQYLANQVQFGKSETRFRIYSKIRVILCVTIEDTVFKRW